MSTKIFKNGKELSPKEIAEHANAVHNIAGGKGNPYTEGMFIPHNEDGKTSYRLTGYHCDCGCDENAIGKPSRGEFELLPLTDSSVREGGKAYMKCRKCGGYSHL